MQLSRILSIALFVSLFAAAGCALEDVSSRSDTIQSCYSTAAGNIKCVSTPGSIQSALTDVDGDGEADTFLCGDGASESDSDLEGVEDSDESNEAGTEVAAEDGTEDDDLDADSESDSESASESDNDCGPSDDDGESDDDSLSDLDGDGDADGVPDADDCDCVAPGGVVVG